MTKASPEYACSRIFSMSERNGDCLLYKGRLSNKGYVCVRVMGRMDKGHRVVYSLFRGPINRGLHVLHSCDVRHCVNPEHLYVGTNSRNIEDKTSRDRSGKKLRIADAREIKRLFSFGMSNKEIASMFGINPSNVSRIRTGERWAHVSGRE